MEKFEIAMRNLYMDKIYRFLENDNLLFVTGVRRAGKSCIAKCLEAEMQDRCTNGERVIRISFEKIDHSRVTADEMIAELKEQYATDKMNYILLDEVIHVVDWERAINLLYRLGNCKLVLFSSNRRIFSNELFAIQEEKYDEVSVFPLSLAEFIEFQGFQETTSESDSLKEKEYRRFDGRVCTIEEIYRYYIIYGGLPILRPEYMDRERAWVVTDGSYGAIVTRDIMEIGSDSNSSAVTDTMLLRTVITIMAKSLGSNISATWVSKQTGRYLGKASSTKTIESYIRALLNAHLFYISARYDIKTDRVMQTLAKYYIVDACFHNYVADIHVDDESCLLENKVFFELLRQGYDVYNGKLGKEEITFVAMKDGQKIYIQVANDASDEYLERIASPLRRIRDDNKRLIFAKGCANGVTYDGIIMMNVLEFLMGKDFVL